jgi:Ca2+-binding EF-hand superfamily protein
LHELSGSSLLTWCRHIDKNSDETITLDEWVEGLKELNFSGDILEVWRKIDVDKSGKITFDEIDEDAARLWFLFRAYLAEMWPGGNDKMFAQLGAHNGQLGLDQFKRINNLGWEHRQTELLFQCIDKTSRGYLVESDFQFVDKQRTRLRLFVSIKKRNVILVKEQRRRKKKLARATFIAFQSYLLKKYQGNLFRAWLMIDLDRSMQVQQAELFKACKRIGFEGDVRLLWKELDADGSGVTGLEEVDPRIGRDVVVFRRMMTDGYGSCVEGFRALDIHRKKRIKIDEFVRECRNLGFHRGKMIFNGIVSEPGKKHLLEEDLRFLDEWEPPEWIDGHVDQSAAEEFKAALLRQELER